MFLVSHVLLIVLLKFCFTHDEFCRKKFVQIDIDTVLYCNI